MIQMLTGQPPWKDRNVNGIVQLHNLVTSSKGAPTYPKDNVSIECQKCIEWCFQHAESDRPTAQELLACEFLMQRDDLDESGNVINAMGRRKLGSMDSAESDNSNGRDQDESFEDSGVMSGLRMQMVRLAQSTESLYKTPRPTSSAGGETRSDTVGEMQNEIARRKLAKQVQDLQRAKDREPGAPAPVVIDYKYEKPANPKKGSSANPFARGSGGLLKKVNSKLTIETTKSPSLVSSSSIESVSELKGQGLPTQHTVFDKLDLRRSGSKIPRPEKIGAIMMQGMSSARDDDVTPQITSQMDDSPLIGSRTFQSPEVEVGDDSGWKCLACDKISHDPSFCTNCATTRGSTGRKGLNVVINRR